jgi:Spx/MgsR family transcriptional regulator
VDAMKIRFLGKKTCSTCRRAKGFLRDRGVEMDERDLGDEPLDAQELESLIGDRDHRPFLNFRNELYRERKMKDAPPTRAEAIRLMAQHPNLIRRPIVVKGREIVLGWDAEAVERLL